MAVPVPVKKQSWADSTFRYLRRGVLHAILMAFAAAIVLPLVWVIGSSLKPVSELYNIPTTLFPRNPTLDSYTFVLNRVPALPSYYANSLIVSIASTIASVIVASLAGYAFARLEFPGRDRIFWGLVISMFLPTTITSLFAIFELTDMMGLLDTRLGLILPYISLGMIVNTFIMRSVFLSIPKELQDAAILDGAGPLQVFVRIMLPLSASGVVVITILHFITAWGEYLLARTLTYDAARTLPVAIATLQPQSGEWHFNTVTASYMLMFGPAFIVLVIIQRWFMKAMTEGAVKW